ncbi:hypothetical protein CLOM_g10066 [Closterium sp. NIES-68]|nr:hypothetical protein CLOM_g22095 [Closterium sp. NIES-68]GJP50914.1 hypothetical protein CLOM_g10066 [Closterium sp. NIES-68]GJP63138.1 hypothetical protein CLOP_g20213 [Closterium sp. NIES-67]GJP67959.1 hypothetical protein CLOP_g24715 [Closterium sp. NIES-67]
MAATAPSAVPAIRLSSGYDMPVVGMGVWRADKGRLGALIKEAVRLGYRHFDCAADYGNEAEVGEALSAVLAEGAVRREELFVTSKLWNSDHAHVRAACEQSIKDLRVGYLDLYLVHFPIATKHTGIGSTSSAMAADGMLDMDISVPLHTVWSHMEALVADGLVRSIGISNYDVYLTRDCLAYASRVKPAVNQVETHPYFQRPSLLQFCSKFGVTVTAHTPLGGGAANEELFHSKSPLSDPLVLELAEKHKKTAAQVVLRWGTQRNTVVIPKSNREDRLAENIAIFDFELDADDMKRMEALDAKARSNNPASFWGIDLYA